LILPTVALLAAALSIDSAGSCPSADAIERALARLNPEPVQTGAAVRVTETPGGLTVAFTWGQGGPTETREIASSAGCEDRAQAVALVIATWVNTPPGLAVSPAPPTIGVSPTVSTPASPRRELSVGGVLDDGRPGAWLELDQGGHHGLGWWAALTATASRTVSLGAAQSRWTRASLAAAARARKTWGLLTTQLDAGPAMSMVLARGDGYHVDQDAYGWNVGAVAGARVGVGRGVRVWLDGRMLGWALRQRLVNQALPGGERRTVDLPRLQAHLALGLTFALP
jgi:hypothetical protein